MHYRFVASTLLGLGLLAACDAVRVPGQDEGVANPPAVEVVDVATPGEDEAASAPTQQPASSTAVAPTPVETGPDETSPTPAPIETTEEAALPGESVIDLAQINAITCGLERTEEETLTVAQSFQQQQPSPQPESLLTTAAVGGMAARLASFPGIVKMEPRRQQGTGIASGHCGATRISERWFVTAAHCVDEGYDEIRFVTGVENVRDEAGAHIVQAELSICHSAFERAGTMPNDIALMRVPEAAISQITSIPIANYGETEQTLSSFNYPRAEMAGWGVTQFNALPSPILLSANLELVSTGAGQLTISSLNGSGPCVGDSGGPLYVEEEDGKMVVVGVLSHVLPNAEGRVCEGEYRGRYTNLQSFLGWMDGVMQACDADTTLCL